MPTFEPCGGVVYLMLLPGEFYKVGWSERPEERYTELRNRAFKKYGADAAGMVLTAYFRAERKDEYRLHRQLSAYRIGPRGSEEYLDHPNVPVIFFEYTGGMMCMVNSTPQVMSRQYYRALCQVLDADWKAAQRSAV